MLDKELGSDSPYGYRLRIRTVQFSHCILCEHHRAYANYPNRFDNAKWQLGDELFKAKSPIEQETFFSMWDSIQDRVQVSSQLLTPEFSHPLFSSRPVSSRRDEPKPRTFPHTAYSPDIGRINIHVFFSFVTVYSNTTCLLIIWLKLIIKKE